MPCLLNIGSFLISSGLIASQLLLEIANCIPWSLQSVSSHLNSSHLKSSLPFSSLSWLQLFNSHVTWAFLISSHLISAYLLFFPHSSSQLFSALRSSCQLIFCLLISSLTLLASSQLFSHLLSWSQPLFSSSHLISALLSALSNNLSSSLAPKTCSKNGSQRQSKWPLRFPQRRFYTDVTQLLNKASFTHNKPLDTASFYTEKILHTASFYREKLLHTEACTQRSLYTAKLLHTEAVTPSKLLHREAFTEAFAHTHTGAFTHRSFFEQRRQKLQLQNRIYAPKPKSTMILKHFLKQNFQRKIASAKIEKICWQITIAAVMQPLHYDLRGPAAKDNSITHAAAVPSNLDAATTMRSTELQNTIELRATASEIAASKPDGSRRPSQKKTISKHFVKIILKGKSPVLPKLNWENLLTNRCRNQDSAYSKTIYDVQLQKTIIGLTRSRGTKQPWSSHYSAIGRIAKHNRTARNGVRNCSFKTGWISAPKPKKDDFEALCKNNFKRKIASAKIEKICGQITIATLMQPFHYDFWCPAAKGNELVLRTQPRHQATLMQPFQCGLQSQNCRTQKNYETWTKMWNRKFRARPPSKPESWRCENEAFARDLPQEWKVENEVFVREFLQKVKAEDVKTKLSCEASLKKWKKWVVEISFILDMTVEAMKTKLSCETALKNCRLKMWNRRCENDFRARPSSKTEDENEAFVPDLLQIVKKIKL